MSTLHYNTKRVNWPDQIHAALVETTNAFRAVDAARSERVPTSEIGRLKRLAYAACERSNALQEECREVFATSRGWRFNKKGGTFDLAKGAHASNGSWFIDHAEFFDSFDQRRVALVTHSYAPPEEIANYAARRGYNAELLPFSWWNPRFSGGCRAVVFTRKIGAAWS
jgi:hypothetical protein